jgi:hypothetical protein
MDSFAGCIFDFVYLDFKYKKTFMTTTQLINYKPNDQESERASNSYLMSVMALIVGLPLPVINLIATFIFYLGNLKATRFVRWHCTQALFSQVAIVLINGFGVSWTLRILFGDLEVTNQYIAYIITVVVFNLFEFIITMYAMIVVRKGKHVEWWVFGPLTNLLFGSVEQNQQLDIK